jgi:hypothetical protein
MVPNCYRTQVNIKTSTNILFPTKHSYGSCSCDIDGDFSLHSIGTGIVGLVLSGLCNTRRAQSVGIVHRRRRSGLRSRETVSSRHHG